MKSAAYDRCSYKHHTNRYGIVTSENETSYCVLSKPNASVGREFSHYDVTPSNTKQLSAKCYFIKLRAYDRQHGAFTDIENLYSLRSDERFHSGTREDPIKGLSKGFICSFKVDWRLNK